MARLYISRNRGQRPMPPDRRVPKSKTHVADTYQDKMQKTRKSGAKYAATSLPKSRRAPIATRSKNDEGSTTSGAESTDEDEQETDDDEAEPEAIAPPRALILHEAGRYQYDRSDDNLSEAGETESMFGGSYNPEEEQELQSRLLDENDDAYLGVDDISESDLDDEKILDEQAKIFLADMATDTIRDDSEDPSFYLNQIEGMSAYGFGDDSDGTAQFFGSSQSSDSGNETLTRHVRFEETMPEPKAFRGFSDSPPLTRALLPSALPDTLMHSLTGDSVAHEHIDLGEETDSDLTDDDLPDIALRTPRGDEQRETPRPTASPGKKLRPPPVGTFIDDGSQSAGILDSTGTMLLITNPQSLGEEFSRRYGASAPPSPGPDFAEAVFGTESQSPDGLHGRVPDPMFSGLTSKANSTPNGQTIGTEGAFFAPAGQDNGVFQPISEIFNDEESVYSDMDEGEVHLNIEDMISFDTDSDGDSPTSPVLTYDAFSSPGLSHLNSGNITAFRRNADSALRALHTSPLTAPSTARVTGASTVRKLKRTRKRKASDASPYSDLYYKGVTPVQRVSHPSNNQLMTSPAPAKRRRMH